MTSHTLTDALHAWQLAIFAKTLRGSKHNEPAYRVLNLAWDSDTQTLKVHVDIFEASWERAGHANPRAALPAMIKAHMALTAEDIGLERLSEALGTPEFDVVIHQHNVLRDGWDFDWARTSKQNNMHMLVAIEQADGRIFGAIVDDAYFASTTTRIADAHAEPEEAAEFIEALRGLAPNHQVPGCKGLYACANIEAPNLEEAMSVCPLTSAGQAHVLLYRADDWLTGIWNTQEDSLIEPGIRLSSVSDFHGTRCSHAKRARRPDVQALLDGIPVRGDIAVIQQSVDLVEAGRIDWKTCYEHPANVSLCNWWNTHAPEQECGAASFRLYWWNEADRIFLPGDPEEPAENASILDNWPCLAAFHGEATPPLVVAFFKHQETGEHGGTDVRFANGEMFTDIGCDPDEWCEAYYGVLGLQRAREHLDNHTPAEALS